MSGHEGDSAPTEENWFPHLNDWQLIARLVEGEPFKTDDEEMELSRRLARRGMTWMWDRENNKVVIVPMEGGDGTTS